MNETSYLEIIATFIVIYAAFVFALFLALLIKAKMRKKEPPEMMTHNLRDGSVIPTKETDAGKLWATIASNRCPDCGDGGGGVFWEGPSGGMSTNIECINPNCKARFNVTPLIGTAERI